MESEKHFKEENLHPCIRTSDFQPPLKNSKISTFERFRIFTTQTDVVFIVIYNLFLRCLFKPSNTVLLS